MYSVEDIMTYFVLILKFSPLYSYKAMVIHRLHS